MRAELAQSSPWRPRALLLVERAHGSERDLHGPLPPARPAQGPWKLHVGPQQFRQPVLREALAGPLAVLGALLLAFRDGVFKGLQQPAPVREQELRKQTDRPATGRAAEAADQHSLGLDPLVIAMPEQLAGLLVVVPGGLLAERAVRGADRQPELAGNILLADASRGEGKLHDAEHRPRPDGCSCAGPACGEADRTTASPSNMRQAGPRGKGCAQPAGEEWRVAGNRTTRWGVRTGRCLPGFGAADAARCKWHRSTAATVSSPQTGCC